MDESLVVPYEDKLVTLISAEDFRDLLPNADMLNKLQYLRRIGNIAAHNPKGVTYDQAVLALQHLHSFLDFVAYCYAADYTEAPFAPPAARTQARDGTGEAQSGTGAACARARNR